MPKTTTKQAQDRTEVSTSNSITYVMIGIAIGAVISLVTTLTVVRWSGQTNQAHMSTSSMMDGDDDSMSHMVAVLKDKSGDDFDKEFIRQMIPHHQGAIAMAELIAARAKHDEIKALGKGIIAAQTPEIDRMKSWYSDWGYGSYGSSMMMDHSMMQH